MPCLYTQARHSCGKLLIHMGVAFSFFFFFLNQCSIVIKKELLCYRKTQHIFLFIIVIYIQLGIYRFSCINIDFVQRQAGARSRGPTHIGR